MFWRADILSGGLLETFTRACKSLKKRNIKINKNIKFRCDFFIFFLLAETPDFDQKISKYPESYEPWPPWRRDIVFCRGRSGGAQRPRTRPAGWRCPGCSASSSSHTPDTPRSSCPAQSTQLVIVSQVFGSGSTRIGTNSILLCPDQLQWNLTKNNLFKFSTIWNFQTYCLFKTNFNSF